MKKAKDLISSLHSKLLKERAILRLAQSDIFRDIYDACQESDQAKCDDYINNLKLEELKLWLKSKIKKEIEQMNISELRVLAQELGVKHYCLLRKDLLVYKIRQLKVEDDGSKI